MLVAPSVAVADGNEAEMQTYGQLLYVDEFTRDDIHYRIAIFRVQGGLLAKWSCGVCQADESPQVAHPSIEECVTAVHQTIEMHHREKHEAPMTNDR